MSTRISETLLLCAFLGGCGSGSATPEQVAQAAGDAGIFCRTGGATEMARRCVVERTGSGAGAILTIRHPDGGFRRLEVVTDGRGVANADGSEEATVLLTGDNQAEVAIAGDRYLLPAVATSVRR
jgi:hypothetical protein